MDSLKKRTPDYTDIAYREAVARLKFFLAESYSPHSSPTKSSQVKQVLLCSYPRRQIISDTEKILLRELCWSVDIDRTKINMLNYVGTLH